MDIGKLGTRNIKVLRDVAQIIAEMQELNKQSDELLSQLGMMN